MGSTLILLFIASQRLRTTIKSLGFPFNVSLRQENF